MRRTRRKRRSLLPTCYKHRKPMLVRRVVGDLQYRYCPVPGCRVTLRTMRPRPAGAEPAGVAAETSSKPAPIVARKKSPRKARACGGSRFENDAAPAQPATALEGTDTLYDAPVPGNWQMSGVLNNSLRTDLALVRADSRQFA